MIEIELDEYTGLFRVTSFDGETDPEASNAFNRKTWLNAMYYLLSCGWEPYACVHIPGSKYPIRHFFKKQVQP